MGASTHDAVLRALAAAVVMTAAVAARAADEGDPATLGLAAAHAAWTARVEASRLEYEKFARGAIEGRAARLSPRFPRRPPSDGRIDDFLADDTLRSGDIVVTDRGFLVFTGGAGAISEDDFAPIMTIRRDTRERETLRDLERASAIAPRE